MSRELLPGLPLNSSTLAAAEETVAQGAVVGGVSPGATAPSGTSTQNGDGARVERPVQRADHRASAEEHGLGSAWLED